MTNLIGGLFPYSLHTPIHIWVQVHIQVAFLSHGSLDEMNRLKIGFPQFLMSLFRERGHKIEERSYHIGTHIQ